MSPRSLLGRASLIIVLLLLAPTAQAQPALDYSRFLGARFHPPSGQFLFGQPQYDLLIFPPSDLDPSSAGAAYEIRNANGALVAQHEVRTMNGTRSDAFRSLQPYSAARWDGALEDGQSYTLRFVLNGQVISSIPFSIAIVEGDDPFNPQTTWTLDGPWRTHAFFRHETARPDYQLFFHAWIGPDEVSVGGFVEVSVRRDGEEVAWASTYVDPDGGWQKVDYQLLTSDSREDERGIRPNATNWTVEDASPGTYEIVFSSEEQPGFRTMTIEAESGAFVAHPRSDMSTERTSFLTPRTLWYDDSQTPTSLYWVVSE